MKLFINALKKRFPVDRFFFHRSYAQEGEDMIYRSFFENRKKHKGFYIDVGAHHPYRFSNTLHFYQNGWNGINIEPTPSSIKLFNILRKRDVNLNCGISTVAGTMPFYCFNESAMNSFSKEISENKAATTRYKISKIVDVKTLPLAQVLDKYLPAKQTIDFLSIDAEGFDLEVLKSNNWNKYIPLFIIIEDKSVINELENSAIYNYLAQRNYQIVAKTQRTSFFKLKSPNSN
jgi:FkbM family methyltransferase